jgi:hypothetical protein
MLRAGLIMLASVYAAWWWCAGIYSWNWELPLNHQQVLNCHKTPPPELTRQQEALAAATAAAAAAVAAAAAAGMAVGEVQEPEYLTTEQLAQQLQQHWMA